MTYYYAQKCAVVNVHCGGKSVFPAGRWHLGMFLAPLTLSHDPGYSSRLIYFPKYESLNHRSSHKKAWRDHCYITKAKVFNNWCFIWPELASPGSPQHKMRATTSVLYPWLGNSSSTILSFVSNMLYPGLWRRGTRSRIKEAPWGAKSPTNNWDCR